MAKYMCRCINSCRLQEIFICTMQFINFWIKYFIIKICIFAIIIVVVK